MPPNLTLTTRLPLPSSAVQIPILGLGVCVSTKCEASILSALEAGYRHIDTAQIYYNERETGCAVRAFLARHPDVPRSEIFICSKLWETDLSRGDMPSDFTALCNAGPWPLDSLEAGHTTYSRAGVREGLERSLETAGLGYFDLYLLHNPRPGPGARVEAWLALQEAVREGKVRAVGVSNWAPRHIEEVLRHPGVVTLPAVNQIEFHPWNQQREIVEFCRSKGIVVVAYSPLTQGKRLGDATIGRVAGRRGRTPAQVVLRWCLQQGVVVIPKSDREARIIENKDLFGWELDEQDMAEIAELDEGQKGNLGEWDPFAWE